MPSALVLSLVYPAFSIGAIDPTPSSSSLSDDATIELMSMTTGALREYSATKEWQNNGPAYVTISAEKIIVRLFPTVNAMHPDGCSKLVNAQN
jgi:hypothetical protein